MTVALDYGNYLVRALTKTTDRDTIAESEILHIVWNLYDKDRYPEANGRIRLSASPENSVLKQQKPISYNSTKFNSNYSIEKEIKALEKLKHPNIMKLFGLFIEDGFVKGLYVSRYDYTLTQILEQNIPFDRMAFMLSLIDTVDYLRSQNYVHADLYEGKIIVLKEDPSTSYLIDFDASEPVGTKMVETTKSFGLPSCDYITYRWDSVSIVEIIQLLFKQCDVEAPST
ncbi:hypothetical protein EV175_004877 [Coemansia sp. RSA 1933]|nr:hypothetical protein EV175_004877 [Coemansia sp. RSA 1933]